MTETGLPPYRLMTPEVLLLAKILVPMAAVLLLTLLAEFGSTRLAGLLSGYPMGTAFSLFFIGIEHGADFAATSAAYTLPAFVASLLLVWAYYRASLWSSPLQPWLAAAVALAVFAVAGLELTRIHVAVPLALLMSSAAIVLCRWRFRGLSNAELPRRVALHWHVLLLRGLFVSAVVVAITELADVIGPAWSGVLSAFPVTLFVFVVLMHLSHGRALAHTVIRNYPPGMMAKLLFALCVVLAYPRIGVMAGTALAYALATAYLLAMLWLTNRRAEARRAH